VSEKFGCTSVDDNGDGLDVESVVQVDSGGTPGVITDDSETFRLDNLEKVKLNCNTWKGRGGQRRF